MRNLVAVLGAAFLCLLVACVALPVPSRYDAMKMATVELSMKDGHGSGVIISPNFILTADHVPADAKGVPMDVLFANGTHGVATMIWHDPKRDIAVMLLQTATKLPPARLSHTPVTMGEEVWIAGYPLDLPLSIQHGEVASEKVSSVPKSDTETTDGAIFLNATMGPGDSGGPVFNSRGEVIGVNDFMLKIGGGSFSGMIAVQAVLVDVCAVTGIN
jgi:S1-C subfamily serine protease